MDNSIKLKRIYVYCFMAFASLRGFADSGEEINKSNPPSALYFSPVMRDVFSVGVGVPVLLEGANDKDGEIEIGVAKLFFENEKLVVKSFSLKENNKNIEFSDQLKNNLKELSDVYFVDENVVDVDQNAKLRLDVSKMRLTLQVAQAGFGVKELARSSLLPEATERSLTGVLNYSGNINYTAGENSNTSAYARFNSVHSLGEHHLYMDGSAYTNESGDNSLTLDRAMYELDLKGRRLAFGMMDAWSLQSLGQVSTFGGTQMVGASFGSVSQSYKPNLAQSLTPINVYFSSAGEARIYRDGRLLSVQQQVMGNHELDARTLPSGIYDVQVEVVIAGKVVSSRTFRVNKPKNEHGLDGGAPSWQVWGGVGRDSKGYGIANIDGDSPQRKNSYIAGISLAGRYLESDWSLAAYYNRDTWVEEAAISRKIGEVQIDLQNVFADDGTRRNVVSLGVPLPYSLGSVNYAREGGRGGSRLDYLTQSRESLGVSLNLAKIHSAAGNLNLSLERYGDKKEGNKLIRWDYNQQLYTGNYGSLTLNLGNTFDRLYVNNNQIPVHSYYAMLNFSLPIAADFSLGYSRSEVSSSLDLSVGASFVDSPISYASVDIGQQTSSSDRSTSYSGYASYDADMVSGVVSASGGSGTSSVSLSGAGAIAWGDGVLGLGAQSGESGVLIENASRDDKALEANINGQHYPLSAGRNFVALAPYQNYSIEVVASGDGHAAFEVEDKLSEVVLYPGNVAHFEPNIKQMVTVFGRLVTPNGNPISNAKLHNHIGSTVTDAQGRFSVDIDYTKPELEVDVTQLGHLKVDIDLLGRQGALMIDDIVFAKTNVQVKVSSGGKADGTSAQVTESVSESLSRSVLVDKKQLPGDVLNTVVQEHIETKYSSGEKDVIDTEVTSSKKILPDIDLQLDGDVEELANKVEANSLNEQKPFMIDDIGLVGVKAENDAIEELSVAPLVEEEQESEAIRKMFNSAS